MVATEPTLTGLRALPDDEALAVLKLPRLPLLPELRHIVRAVPDAIDLPTRGRMRGTGSWIVNGIAVGPSVRAATSPVRRAPPPPPLEPTRQRFGHMVAPYIVSAVLIAVIVASGYALLAPFTRG